MIFVSEIVEKHIGLDFGNCQRVHWKAKEGQNV